MVSGHHIRLIQVSNFLDLNIYAKTPWGPRVYITVDLEGFVYSAVSYTALSRTSLQYPVLSAADFFDY